MLRTALPPGVGEALLFVLIVGVLVFVFRTIGRRKQFAAPPTEGDNVPILETQQRIRAQIVAARRDPAQNVWLVQAKVGRRNLVFCAADYGTKNAAYQQSIEEKTPLDIALFGLATLAPGDVTTIKGQIRDYDKVNPTPDFVTMLREGQYANDYFVVASLMDARDEPWDDATLRVYRAQVIRSPDFTLNLDLAIQPENAEALTPPLFAHGSTRLFGYLAA